MLVTRREKRYYLDTDGVTFLQCLSLDIQCDDGATKVNSLHICIYFRRRGFHARMRTGLILVRLGNRTHRIV